MSSSERPPRRPRAPRSPEQVQARALAQERREAIRVRERRIRRSVAALAATLFSVAFLVIYVQLASGHDPALVTNAKHATAANASSSTESLTASGSESAESSTESSSSIGEEPSSSASAVTTSQS
jgi:hypothetical protein